MTLERGLSPRTREAYLRDVAGFAAFLAARGTVDLVAVRRSDVTDFLSDLRAKRRKASTRARACVAVRQFLST